MRRTLFYISLVLIGSSGLTVKALAESRWAVTSGGTFDWNASANWNGTFPPGSADDVRVTNDLGSAQIITNMGGSSAIGATNTINFLAVSNGLGSASISLIQAPGVFWRTSFGLQLGKNAALVLTTNAVVGQDNNVTFNLRAGGQPGTLVLSNASPATGLGSFVIAGAGATTNGIVNAGTIQFKPNNGQLVSMNYGQTLVLTNDLLGTVVISGSGTGAFIGNFGGQNRILVNNGTILVNAGTFRHDPRDAFNRGGFHNTSTGFVEVDTNAVFEIRRTTNAWANAGSTSPTNSGTLFMNGGTMLTFDIDTTTTNTARAIVNAGSGLIRGNGLLNFTMNNLGAIEARDGTLSVVASIGNLGTWVSTNFGGGVSVLNFTTGNFDLGGGSLLNSNGTVRLINGANTTLSTAYRQNWGTIDFAGTANLLVPNISSAGALTNEFVVKKTAAGNATITTGFGVNTNNFGFANNGTIIVEFGDSLTFNPNNAFTRPFSNSPTGTIFVGTNSAVRISRTATAWNSATLTTQMPVNAGTLTLFIGSLETADAGVLATNRFILNTGRITGNGTISASVSNLVGGVIAPGIAGIGYHIVNGGMAFGSNSALEVDLGAVSGNNDLLMIANLLALDPNSSLNIAGGVAGQTYTVATFSARSGTFGTNTPGYNVLYSPTAIAITFATHTITAGAGANGMIIPSGSVIVTNGDNQGFTITANPCYHIDDVLVDLASVGPVSSYTFTNVTADHTITASFAVDSFLISATAGNNGSISPAGSVNVNCGANQTFSITASNGYHIADVAVDSISIGPVSSYTFTNVTANHTISASFAIDTFTINATAGANGTITPSGAVSVNYGDNQSFAITPDSCYHVDDVLVDSSSVGAVSSYTFTNVTANHSIDASFAIDTYTIVATAGTNGTISPAGTITVNCGTNQDFTITADPGYPTVDVLVDGTNSVGPVNSYTFSNITTNHTLDASFATNLFRVLSISREGNDVNLSWPVAGGHSYTVQTTPGSNGSFSTNDFIDLTTLTIPGIGESITNYTDEGGATNNPARYYRIHLEP